MEKDKKQEGLNAEDKALNLFAEMMIEKIEGLQKNWQKPWFTEGSMWPKNLSGREYNGMNAFMLMFLCEKNSYKIPRFCTFKQVQDLNTENGKDLPRVSVKKGELSFPVLFTTFTCVHKETKERIKYDEYKQLSPAEQELYKLYPSTQVFRVFNVAQTNLQEARPELWAKLETETRGQKSHIEAGQDYSFAHVDKMIQDNLWICPILPKYQDRAYFSFSENKIVVPEKTQFKSGESFYGTLFHEMTHSTGREGVLNRIKPTGMGSDEYAREELVAEMGAALVAQRYGMSRHIKEDSCAYLKAWVDKLKESPQFIKTTLGDVKKATAMITQKIDRIAQAIEQEQHEEIHETTEPEYKQLAISFDEPVEEVKYDALLEPEPLRAEVEFANVQRVFEESKAFQFSAPNKITQPRDVAYIFKQLETSAVENAFAVLVKDGKPTVIHLSMGTTNRTSVSLDAAIVADKKINADKIYFVHNHPSGNVYASAEDVAMLNKWEQVFGDKMQPGIIINSRTGLFGTFSVDRERTQEELTMEEGQKQYPVKLYSFSRLVFNRDYKEREIISSSSDVAALVAGQRLGERDKLSYLVLANNGGIQANVHTAHSSVEKNNVKGLAAQIANDTNVFGGTTVITYGSTALTKVQVKRLQEELRYRDIVLQDHINVQAEANSLVMDTENMPYKYQSACDQGWLNYMGWLDRVKDAKEAELDFAEEQDLYVGDRLRRERFSKGVMTEEEYLASMGYTFMGYSDPALHKGRQKTERAQEKIVKDYANSAKSHDEERAELRKEYREKVERGELRAPTEAEQTIEQANGNPESAATQAARRSAEKRGINWRVEENPTWAQEEEMSYGQEQLRFAKKADEFERIRDLAVQNKGLVIPGLMDKEVPLVGVEPHDFHGEKPIVQAKEWSKKNLVKEHLATDNTGNQFKYEISVNAIKKYLSEAAIIKSENLGVHLAVLKELPKVIANSAEVEIHPDYLKGPDGKRRVENGYAPNVLMHRFYGAIDIEKQSYRVKTTIQEIGQPKGNCPHSYEVTKIEMLDLRPSISLEPMQLGVTTPSIGLAKLLHGIEKSYDPGKKILDESQKLQQGVRQNQEKCLKERFSTPHRKIQPKPRKRGRGL